MILKMELMNKKEIYFYLNIENYDFSNSIIQANKIRLIN